MLAYNGVVLIGLQLFRRLARILAVHIEMAGVGGADQLDTDAGGFCHDKPLLLNHVDANASSQALPARDLPRTRKIAIFAVESSILTF